MVLPRFVHLVVWAQFGTHAYWPAKVIDFNDQMVNVRFFDDHTKADMLATKCFLYSEFSSMTPEKSKQHENALKVITI